MLDKHSLATAIKKIIYPRGEHYYFSGNRIRFQVGSRPLKRKYINSESWVVRNELLQLEYFEKHYRKGDVIWDLGAHFGEYSLFAASMNSAKDRVFAFEPDQDALKVFRKNISLNRFEDKIFVSELVIDEKDGEVLFHSQGGNSNSHIVSGKYTKDDGMVRLRSKSLNSLLHELPKPDVVKIDTEGAEIQILKGADELLADHSIRFICELHPYAWEGFGVTYTELCQLLERHQRKITVLDERIGLEKLPLYCSIVF
jgi:FkbM family methyltransferase